jgi:hypothetical protein
MYINFLPTEESYNAIHEKIAKQQPRLLPEEKEPFNPSEAPLRAGFILLGTSPVYSRSAETVPCLMSLGH